MSVSFSFSFFFFFLTVYFFCQHWIFITIYFSRLNNWMIFNELLSESVIDLKKSKVNPDQPNIAVINLCYCFHFYFLLCICTEFTFLFVYFCLFYCRHESDNTDDIKLKLKSPRDKGNDRKQKNENSSTEKRSHSKIKHEKEGKIKSTVVVKKPVEPGSEIDSEEPEEWSEGKLFCRNATSVPWLGLGQKG